MPSAPYPYKSGVALTNSSVLNLFCFSLACRAARRVPSRAEDAPNPGFSLPQHRSRTHPPPQLRPPPDPLFATPPRPSLQHGLFALIFNTNRVATNFHTLWSIHMKRFIFLCFSSAVIVIFFNIHFTESLFI